MRGQFLNWSTPLKPIHKQLLWMTADFVMLGLVFNSAMMLRVGGLPDTNTLISAVGLPAVTVALFAVAGVYTKPVDHRAVLQWNLMNGIAVGFAAWTMVLDVLPPGHYPGPAAYGLYLIGGFCGTNTPRMIADLIMRR